MINAKRLFDVTAASAGLVFLGPLLAFIGLAVVAGSGFPILFRQTRVGAGGRAFRLNKFRTMRVRQGAENGAFDAGQTCRVTAVGRVLRDTKLDELPQLWNVLLGDMSLVGPRPEVRRWVEAYPARWARVLTVRPGITDPAAIAYRDEEALLAQSPDPEGAYRRVILPHKLDLYERYIDRRTFSGDLLILLKTIRLLVTG